jgi:hypothetical protein
VSEPELEWLQYHAPANLWNHLLSQVRSLFKGKVLYDTNWDFVRADYPIPTWFLNPLLDAIGVSTYLSLVTTRILVLASQAVHLWNAGQTALKKFCRGSTY